MSDAEYLGEFGGEGAPRGSFNPIGEYYGGRNNKTERHGRGRAVHANGDLYLGCYFRGKRHGLGVYRYRNGNGARYGGDWDLGSKHGWGTMYFPDGSQYTGNWNRGYIHGWGVYVYGNGDEYEGSFFMGAKNGRGIYRTKATKEKFVGTWLLGLKHGPGMIIQPDYRFIGNWHNDLPRGAGVYVFPDLNVEQHGRFTSVRLAPKAVEKYKGLGYQVTMMRSSPAAADPMEVEINTRSLLQTDMSYGPPGEENAGEGELKSPRNSGKSEKPKTVKKFVLPPEVEMELRLAKKLKEFVNTELESQETDRVPVAIVWRAMRVTPLMTKYPDESVPPPPIPQTPMPIPADDDDEDEDEDTSKKFSVNDEDSFRKALLEAKDHKLGEIYLGSGVCQLPLSNIRWPDDFIPPRTFSKIAVATIEEFKNVVESVAPQLEPLDIQAIIAENANVFRGHGIAVSDKWKECLGNEAECAEMEMKGPPTDGPTEKRKSSNAAPPTDALTEQRKSSNAADENRKSSNAPPLTDSLTEKRKSSNAPPATDSLTEKRKSGIPPEEDLSERRKSSKAQLEAEERRSSTPNPIDQEVNQEDDD